MAKDLKAEFKTALKIDRDDLDTALVEQPELYQKVAEAYAWAVSDRDGAKLELEETEAELEQDVRKQLAKSIGEKGKVTEGMVKSRLATMPKIQDLHRAYLDAKREADLWGALEESYNQRLSAMKELVALRLRELWSISVKGGSAERRTTVRDIQAERAQQMRREVMRGRQ